VTNRDLINRIIYQISQILSEDTWITDFVAKIDYRDLSGELTIGGSCKGYPGINELITGLRDTGCFQEIKPVSSKVMIDQVTKEEIVNFVINLTLRKIE
jgi:hypothetical protein